MIDEHVRKEAEKMLLDLEMPNGKAPARLHWQ
jgi:hypothetical protein